MMTRFLFHGIKTKKQIEAIGLKSEEARTRRQRDPFSGRRRADAPRAEASMGRLT